MAGDRQGRLPVGTLAAIIFLSFFQHRVTSQETSLVLPSGDSTSEANNQAGKVLTPQPNPQCTVLSVNHVRDEIEDFLSAGAKLVQLDLRLVNYPPNFLQYHLPSVFQAESWTRATGRQGTSLLTLEDSYDFMSLFFLSIGVYQQNVSLVDRPWRCLRGLPEVQALRVLREVLLNDFLPLEQGGGPLVPKGYVCNRKVADRGGYAEFSYTCCHKGSNGDTVCDDVFNDEWISLLLTFIFVLKVLVVLFSPCFLPDRWYRLTFQASAYIYRLPVSPPSPLPPAPPLAPAPAAAAPRDGAGDRIPPPPAHGGSKSLNVVITHRSDQYQEDSKVVHVSRLGGMETFRTLVTSRLTMDVPYRLTYDHARLSVRPRRLLGENQEPVGLLRLLYSNLLRCRIRRLAPIKACCEADVLRWPPVLKHAPDTPVHFPWSKCARILARFLLLLLMVSPWVVRVWLFYAFESERVQAKLEAVGHKRLVTSLRGSLTVYLTPLHGFFVVIYLIVAVDAFVYTLVPPSLKEQLYIVFTKCLRDSRERSKLQVLGWLTWLLLLPFEKLGCVGLLLLPFYLLLLAPLALPLALFYLFPALNITVRLLLHLFLFICPAGVRNRWEHFTDRFTVLREALKLHEVTGNESFERGEQMSAKCLGIQICVILLCLVSFWSVTFLLMEVVSFFVEMAAYTLMGIIVNAGKTLHYITVVVLTVMYGKTTFSEVTAAYLTYNRTIHKLLVGMERSDVDRVARLPGRLQDNEVFRVLGEAHEPPTLPDVRLIVKKGRPLWRTSSLLVFLDRTDASYIPEKFFQRAVLLNCCGVPGPIHRQFVRACWSFGRILVFLFFVFVVVMAFGDVCRVSTTNQLLATVVGGFIPFLFRYVFTASGGRDSVQTDGVQFKAQFREAINTFVQNWPVQDIVPTHLEKSRPSSSSVLLDGSEDVLLGGEGRRTSGPAGDIPVATTSANHGPGSQTSLNLSEISVEEHGATVDEYDPERLDLIIDLSKRSSAGWKVVKNLRTGSGLSYWRRRLGRRQPSAGEEGEKVSMHRSPSPLLGGPVRV